LIAEAKGRVVDVDKLDSLVVRRQRVLWLQQSKAGVAFDAIYTAEDIGSYKPSLRNFEYMLEKLGGLNVAKEVVLHTAESMFHDHRPANELGLKSCWIYRRHADQGFGATMHPGGMPHYDFRFTSMAELAKAHHRNFTANAIRIAQPERRDDAELK